MSMVVEKGDPRDVQATALLRQSHALMQELFDPEENHFLSVDALCSPDIRFFVARDGNVTLGTGALALRARYGEVKSMFTAPEGRGRGVAGAILDRIEAEARAEGLPALRLETGDKLEAAHRLYRGRGFVECGPFGDYTANSSSLFMEKRLD